MSKPRLLHIITSLERGGAELSLTKLLPHLQQDFDNHVICLIGRGPVGQQIEEVNIPVQYIELKHQLDISGIWKLRKLIRKLDSNLLVSYLLFADIIARLANWKKLPLVSAQRSSLHRRQYLRIPEKLTSFLVDHYVVQTESAKSWLLNPSKATVIPNAVNTQPATVTTPGVETVPIVTCVSNLRPEKNIGILIRAIYQLPVTDYQLLIIGSGPDKKRLKKLSHDLKLNNRIQFLGSKTNKEVQEILRDSDIFVHPSPAEGMSNAILEAMAAELPVIAAEIPANRALIQNNETGFLFISGSSQDLSEKISHLISNPELAAKVGASAREHVQQLHSPEVIASQWSELIKSLL